MPPAKKSVAQKHIIGACLPFERPGPQNTGRTLDLIDGSSYFFRAFYAIRHLSNSKGLPTNAAFGFVQMLLKVLKDLRPDYLAVILDSKAPTFRSEIYKEYKANRGALPESLVPQIPYIKKVIEGYRIALLEKEGYEADDLIGTVARRLESEVDVVIVTGDKDLLQLVSDRVQVYDSMKEKRFGVEEVIERFGVSPEQVTRPTGLIDPHVEVRPVTGDKSNQVDDVIAEGPG